MTLDPALLSRIEDAGLNASAPREQRWVDGWLLRTAPGKAKRARCVQPVAAGTGPLYARLARCAAAFRAAGLPMFVRITPFAQPSGLDAALAARGFATIDDTLVMACDAARIAGEAAAGADLEPLDAVAYARWIGAARGSSAVEIAAHADRIAHSPVPYAAFVLRETGDASVAGGQVAIEDDLAGFYDVLTLPSHRCRGLGERVCRGLAAFAFARGVRTLYLQVDAANTPAVALYRRLGFEDAYRYHYRTPPPT